MCSAPFLPLIILIRQASQYEGKKGFHWAGVGPSLRKWLWIFYPGDYTHVLLVLYLLLGFTKELLVSKITWCGERFLAEDYRLRARVLYYGTQFPHVCETLNIKYQLDFFPTLKCSDKMEKGKYDIKEKLSNLWNESASGLRPSSDQDGHVSCSSALCWTQVTEIIMTDASGEHGRVIYKALFWP